MKAIPIQEAEGKLGQLTAEACRGELVVLTDGERKVTLDPGLNLNDDGPELEAELLKAANGPFAPLREGELRDIADRALREHRAAQRK